MIAVEKKLSLKKQSNLLGSCLTFNLNLNEELRSMNLSYENLRYRKYKTIPESPAKYTTPEDYDFVFNGVPFISFFSGAGGLDLGFKYAGYQHLTSIERNQLFCKTLINNFPNWDIIGPPNYRGDISDRKELSNILQSKLGRKINAHFDGIFMGGPPCQPFSIAANQRFSRNGNNFKRIGFEHPTDGNLLFDYIWFIRKFKPKVFLIENVRGICEIDNGMQLKKALKLLTNDGYYVTNPTVLNSADYGVPQNRIRVFIIGSLINKEFIFPRKDPIHVPCYKVFEKDLNGTKNHITRKHKATSIIRYLELDYGEREKLGRVDRLNPSIPSKTIISGGSTGGGRSHLHPFIPRTLSVREAARLQTFPDNFIFAGAPARQFTQVGNAVPPLLALKLATAIYQQFFK